MFFGMKGMLVSAVVALAVGIGAGWKAASIYYGVEIATEQLEREKARSAALEDNLRQINEALVADQKAAEKDLATTEEMKRKANDLVENSSSDPALSAATVERLREYFGRTGSR